MPIAASLACGFIFGLGLLVSGLVRTEKVLGFLDILGAWDPSLLVTMAAALAVSSVGYAIAKRLGRPLLAPRSLWPTRADIDRPLLTGAALFGVGWGLTGLCPGPALENLATLSPGIVDFVAAMTAGMVAHDRWQSWRAAVRSARERAVEADG
jgi:uncharacterized membrane protein YedE/YeeE